MALRASTIDSAIATLDQQLSRVGGGEVKDAVVRFRADATALRFHLRDAGDRPAIIVILGGTGTGKSTVLNRLLGADVSAASYRRTFTAGAIAIVSSPGQLPSDWLGIPHSRAEQLPARGEADRLIVVQ